jgi:hypothetical protein
MTLAEALNLSTRLTAGSVALQTLELLWIRQSFSDRGIWRFASLATEFSTLPWPLRWLTLTCLPYAPFLGLLSVQLAVCALLLALGPSPALVVIAMTTLLVCARFRGTFNGGSDSMTVLALLGLSVAALFPARPRVALGGLGYIALQATLSYFVAGVIKLKEPSWRRGRALAGFSQLPRYGVPAGARALLGRPVLGRFAAWTILLFECAFPLALLGPRICLPFLVLSLVFHVLNDALFGLNRFLFAWAAAYPAIYYVSQFGPLGGSWGR